MIKFAIPDSVHAEVDADGRLVLLNGATGQWHVLNRPAAEIYDAVRNHNDIDRATRTLVDRHPTAGQRQDHLK